MNIPSCHVVPSREKVNTKLYQCRKKQTHISWPYGLVRAATVFGDSPPRKGGGI
jgi:hypothetical protein